MQLYTGCGDRRARGDAKYENAFHRYQPRDKMGVTRLYIRAYVRTRSSTTPRQLGCTAVLIIGHDVSRLPPADTALAVDSIDRPPTYAWGE